MSGNGLNDTDERVIAEAEAALSRLLSIKPSPDFAAKVRMRISAEPRPSSRWTLGWRLGLAAASIVVLGIGVSLATRRGASDVPQPAPAPIVASVQPAPPSTSPVASDQTRIVRRGPRPPNPEPRRANRVLRPAANEPEVLVPPDQRVALARALAMTRDGALDQRLFPPPPEPAAAGEDAPLVAPLVIDEVLVPLISVSGVEKEPGQH